MSGEAKNAVKEETRRIVLEEFLKCIQDAEILSAASTFSHQQCTNSFTQCQECLVTKMFVNKDTDTLHEGCDRLSHLTLTTGEVKTMEEVDQEKFEEDGNEVGTLEYARTWMEAQT
jgi:hypothetical protein